MEDAFTGNHMIAHVPERSSVFSPSKEAAARALQAASKAEAKARVAREAAASGGARHHEQPGGQVFASVHLDVPASQRSTLHWNAARLAVQKNQALEASRQAAELAAALRPSDGGWFRNALCGVGLVQSTRAAEFQSLKAAAQEATRIFLEKAEAEAKVRAAAAEEAAARAAAVRLRAQEEAMQLQHEAEMEARRAEQHAIQARLEEQSLRKVRDECATADVSSLALMVEQAASKLARDAEMEAISEPKLDSRTETSAVEFGDFEGPNCSHTHAQEDQKFDDDAQLRAEEAILLIKVLANQCAGEEVEEPEVDAVAPSGDETAMVDIFAEQPAVEPSIPSPSNGMSVGDLPSPDGGSGCPEFRTFTSRFFPGIRALKGRMHRVAIAQATSVGRRQCSCSPIRAILVHSGRAANTCGEGLSHPGASRAFDV
ncbi:hypothetical protein AB1Y20_014014 [Prymnesium parvum]|uniref:Uncharacterized protein n=1 Tax=Prymnesium parvum TaxID=97485 RepID=A0AB34II47_PRYPA